MSATRCREQRTVITSVGPRYRLLGTYLSWLVAGVIGGCGRPPVESVTDTQAFPEPSIAWNPERYIAYRTAGPMVIDGEISESSWQVAQWTRDFVDIEGSARSTPRFRTRVRMLWDDTYFYVAAELEEPHVWGTLTRRDAVIYHDNDFEVFLDPDGDAHEYYELEINALGTIWDLLLIKPYRDGGPAINAWDIRGLQTGVSVQGTLNDPSDRDEGWTVEIAFPWDVLREAAHRRVPPSSGDQWRVNFSRVEWRTDVLEGQYQRLLDHPPGRARPEDNWVWSPQGVINMHYPEMWGFVQFSERMAEDPGDAFLDRPVERAKWALWQVYYKQRGWYSRWGRYAVDLRTLGLNDLDWSIDLSVTDRQFEASTLVGGRIVSISHDGRIRVRDAGS